ncbi:hypothetical protein ACLKMH_13065 [Psychromonas sp. KJ10-10]|uniref:hypothetical protein n=1 Tax=Psychromonas sp. KJ10-10 TaxID=3391823 RepID=UPI0039B3ED89
MADLQAGSCLCGSVKFEIEGRLKSSFYAIVAVVEKLRVLRTVLIYLHQGLS